MSAYLPATRTEALARLEAFLPHAPAYAVRRNHVEVGHENVSRLSPATRTRLILEREILAAVRRHHDPAKIEKFEQEVWWRLYWKGWLEQRPAIWSRYREDLHRLTWSDRALVVAAGESGVEIMDHFARQLIETGYLHNHARMWWASFWIHVEGLPWQLGADFFLRHLLDGDAASNTLSWRWVAGLHTRGKSYLVRRSNLERCVDPAILSRNLPGIERLDGPAVRPCLWEEPPAPINIEATSDPSLTGKRWGLWIHDEDLSVEYSTLPPLRPVAAIATLPAGIHESTPQKNRFLRSALADGASRSALHFGVPCAVHEVESPTTALVAWAEEARLETVVALRPFCGPLADSVPALAAALAAKGVDLELVRRKEDAETIPYATGSFFKFWNDTPTLRDPTLFVG